MEKITVVNIYNRIKSETPKFWKKVRYLMIGCGAVGGSLMAVPAAQISWLPDNIIGILITIGVVGTSLASLTVHDQNKQNNEQK